MKLTPRVQLLLLVGLFALPIVASTLTYIFIEARPTANYGELLTPSPVAAHAFERAEGTPFTFAALKPRWILVASDSGRCAGACRDKLTTMRQVRLALGRKASRVERVFVVDDLAAPDPGLREEFEGTVVVRTPPGMTLPPGAANDRAHIYLVDPHGDVMMRWPAAADGKRMLKDLERLLKASQIG
jgi:cytochrome oxidase Cu insertion factor (SCO1/SenC/PrrC family)